MSPVQTTLENQRDPAHDPGVREARRRGDLAAEAPHTPLRMSGGGQLRIGTASWTDPTLTEAGVFYPEGRSSAEERLRYYAERFSLVEVDSTYYALPARRMAELWVERTPDDFRFNVKAHALMTGQPSEVSRLPRSLRDALPAELGAKRRIYGTDLPPELADEVWRLFHDAMEPLVTARKLGAVLVQYPRWFMPNRENSDAILEARARLAPLPVAIEVRNGRWLANEDRADRFVKWLAKHDLSYVVVDQPQGLDSSVPPISALASPRLAVVRFHGRRTETWERPEVGVLERFRYLYDEREMTEWVPRIADLASRAAETHVIMNNCYANYGTTNAAEFAQIFQRVTGATKLE